MSVTSKSLTFALAPEFRGSCKLALAFVPSGGVAFKDVFPVAWKVFELNEGGSQTVVWTDNLAGCRATVDSADMVTMEEYQAVPSGYSTDLLLDNSQPKKPLYSFTEPSRFGGAGNVKSRVGNMTGIDIDRFGTGFVVEKNGKETMDTVLVMKPVKDGASVYINYIPLLKVWANASVKQSEILPAALDKKATAWEADLSQLSEKRINIQISREKNGTIKGTVVADESKSIALASVAQDSLMDADAVTQVTYTANITFTMPNIVSRGMNTIANHLPAQVYPHTKIVIKGSDIAGLLTLTLPAGGSCNQAEQDVIAAIKKSGTSYGKAFVTSHSGAACLTSDDGREEWVEIYPTIASWYGETPLTEGVAFDAPADAEAFATARAIDAAAADGDDDGDDDDESDNDA